MSLASGTAQTAPQTTVRNNSIQLYPFRALEDRFPAIVFEYERVLIHQNLALRATAGLPLMPVQRPSGLLNSSGYLVGAAVRCYLNSAKEHGGFYLSGGVDYTHNTRRYEGYVEDGVRPFSQLTRFDAVRKRRMAIFLLGYQLSLDYGLTFDFGAGLALGHIGLFEAPEGLVLEDQDVFLVQRQTELNEWAAIRTIRINLGGGFCF